MGRWRRRDGCSPVALGCAIVAGFVLLSVCLLVALAMRLVP